MTKRRSRGDGGLHWDERRQRWIASLTIGYTPAGKRLVKTASGKTKTEAKNKLKEIIRDFDDGLAIAQHGYTVGQAVNDWLTYGLPGRGEATHEKLRILADLHVTPLIGARKLRELSADEVDVWLAGLATKLSTRTLRDIRSILLRAINRAQARDKVKRNVVMLCECPTGKTGRPSKSLNYAQAEALLLTAESDNSTIGAYVVVSLLSGCRTEEVRPLPWKNLVRVSKEELANRAASEADKPKAHVNVWRSVRAGGDTKTRKSRRSLGIGDRCLAAFEAQEVRLQQVREDAGDLWQENGLVFASETGTMLDAANVRRGFRRLAKAAGLNPNEWTPRELRHSFVSLLSDGGLTLEQISRLVGHSSTAVTETVYRHQLNPVVEDGATAMDRIFPS
ncbi:tyrosine-type recombinase/integrase [Actinokineospora auranticolor]|uniref:Site-specific recombinase XerD n=1 Tax=Actinokineospora auranticolor TaxID=155976 RepID=A0A2S6GKW3_9PSEU|nr:tyrosine-type recombinase/integrase [Actinokineospora auranticolor]PPK65830.1 site-specific recombinase XerD [Actinokineospora auranticolor]